MTGFFGITEQDLADGKAKFNNGDTAEMTIAAVSKKDINNRPKIILDCVVTNGNNAGLKYSEFFGLDSEGGRKALGAFLTSFMSAKEAATLQDPNVLVNKKFSCKFEESNGYVNMRNVRQVTNVPAGMGNAAPSAPAAQTAAIQPEQQSVSPELSKSLF